MYFNKGTQIEVVEYDNHDKTKYFFISEEGVKLNIGDVLGGGQYEVVSLHPLKVVEFY